MCATDGAWPYLGRTLGETITNQQGAFWPSLRHLRLAFSLFLLPIFLFALSSVPQPDWLLAAEIFIILHLLLSPASNAYNSWYDKDVGPIGGLAHPPPVHKGLLTVAWGLDAAALIWGWFVSPAFAAGLLLYGIVSKLYSHPRVRLKRYPFISLAAAAVFQGGLTYAIIVEGLGGWPADLYSFFLGIAAATAMIAAFYPMTQIYQHDEDAHRGDLTVSRAVGLRGTFYLSAGLFALADVLFFLHYFALHQRLSFWVMQACLLPAIVYFAFWYIQVLHSPARASYAGAMRLNALAAGGMILFFLTRLLA